MSLLTIYLPFSSKSANKETRKLSTTYQVVLLHNFYFMHFPSLTKLKVSYITTYVITKQQHEWNKWIVLYTHNINCIPCHCPCPSCSLLKNLSLFLQTTTDGMNNCLHKYRIHGQKYKAVFFFTSQLFKDKKLHFLKKSKRLENILLYPFSEISMVSFKISSFCFPIFPLFLFPSFLPPSYNTIYDAYQRSTRNTAKPRKNVTTVMYCIRLLFSCRQYFSYIFFLLSTQLEHGAQAHVIKKLKRQKSKKPRRKNDEGGKKQLFFRSLLLKM